MAASDRPHFSTCLPGARPSTVHTTHCDTAVKKESATNNTRDDSNPIDLRVNLASSISLQESMFRTSASSQLRSRQFGLISLSSGPLVFAASATQDDEKHPVLHACPTVRVWPGALDMSHHTCLSEVQVQVQAPVWGSQFQLITVHLIGSPTSCLLCHHPSVFKVPATHLSISSTTPVPSKRHKCHVCVLGDSHRRLHFATTPGTIPCSDQETKRSISSISSLGISRVNASKQNPICHKKEGKKMRTNRQQPRELVLSRR